MNRRSFVKSAAVLGTSLALPPYAQALPAGFPVVRPPVSARRFQSKAGAGIGGPPGGRA